MEELDRFRQEWRREVAQKQIFEEQQQNTKAASSGGPNPTPAALAAAAATASRAAQAAAPGEPSGSKPPHLAPSSHSSFLTPNEAVFSVHAGAETSNSDYNFSQDELDALELFEAAVDREHTGKLSDAVVLYRDAFRKNEQVDKLYREKWFSHYKTKPPVATVSREEAPRAIKEVNYRRERPGDSEGGSDYGDEDNDDNGDSLLALSMGKINLEEANLDWIKPDDESKYCPFIEHGLPLEIIEGILGSVAQEDLASFGRVLATCRLFNRVGTSSQLIWRALAMREYPYQQYTREAQEEIYGEAWDNIDESNKKERKSPGQRELGVLWDSRFNWKGQWRLMYMYRPRARFDGIYISTCNYLRPGRSEGGWNAPVIMVTYYRYLRFFRDGSCMSLLTTDEPRDVVPVFVRSRYLMQNSKPAGKSSKLGSTYSITRTDGSVISRSKDIVGGTWVQTDGAGTLLLRVDGSVPRYEFYLQLEVRSSGTKRHNKLRWARFWGEDRTTREPSDFNLKHDKPYYFLRYRYAEGA